MSFWLLWGTLGVLWESLGVPGTSLGASGAISGIFREILGALLVPCWGHFSMIFGIFYSLGFCIDFVWLLGGFLVDFA